jgi:sodium transport system ATP-binding protein
MIRFEGLTKRYGSVTAVRDLTLRVRPGEVYALLGPNGAGKTTALRCLATLLEPSAGTALVAGIDVRTDPLGARRRMAFLAASMGLYERLSARELVAYFGRLHGLRGVDLAARVEEMIDVFAVAEFADRWCGRLSTGQRQRVSLARALVHDPAVLVLDEPTMGLDLLSGRTIHEFIRNERGRGKAVLFSTHQMDEVGLLADRVGVLRRGALVSEGTPAEVARRAGEPTLAHAFLALVADPTPERPERPG